MRTDSIPQPKGYLFRVNMRQATDIDAPTDIFADVSNFPQRVSRGKVLGDAHVYTSPYTLQEESEGDEPTVLGKSVVREDDDVDVSTNGNLYRSDDRLMFRKSQPV